MNRAKCFLQSLSQIIFCLPVDDGLANYFVMIPRRQIWLRHLAFNPPNSICLAKSCLRNNIDQLRSRHSIHSSPLYIVANACGLPILKMRNWPCKCEIPRCSGAMSRDTVCNAERGRQTAHLQTRCSAQKHRDFFETARWGVVTLSCRFSFKIYMRLYPVEPRQNILWVSSNITHTSNTHNSNKSRTRP